MTIEQQEHKDAHVYTLCSLIADHPTLAYLSMLQSGEGYKMEASSLIRSLVATVLSLGIFVACNTGEVFADNQTPTVSPVSKDVASLPYILRLRQREMPKTLPTLQSFSAGQSQGLWVLIGGRTNGMHGFTDDPLENFPPRRQNRRIWVIDPVTGNRWSRSLADSSLSPRQLDELSSFAAQHVQIGDTLYVVGGYGFSRKRNDFRTFSSMTAFDLPNIIKWVRREGDFPAGNADLAALIRQTRDKVLKVTGGQMTMLGNRAILAFGQLFDGGYGSPDHRQVYTTQVRSFRILDDGVTLAIDDVRRRPEQPNPDDYRRRDYPMMPILDTSGDRPVPKAVALAGVFTLTDGMFTVPVEIDRAGRPTMADPTAPSTFKQAMSGYDCAVLPIFDRASGESHGILFGGISYVFYRRSTDTFVEDPMFPFIHDVTAIVRTSAGDYSQVLIGQFPRVLSVDNKRLRFGAEAAVFLKPSMPVTRNGMLDLVKLKETFGSSSVHVGWIFGGIASDKPNSGSTVASNLVFEIYVTPR
jgi:hypothetical protein